MIAVKKTNSEIPELIRNVEKIFPEIDSGKTNLNTESIDQLYEDTTNLNTESIDQLYEDIKCLKFEPLQASVKTPSFHCLQKWEGTVIELESDSFLAKLNDLTSNNPPEITEFSISDVPDDDKDLLRIGAIFFWYVGYTKSIQGQLTRGSTIRFRRLPVWSEREIEQAKLESDKIRNDIGWK